LYFINSLNSGSDFGQAYLAKAPTLDGNPQFILLGAGNLKSAPYIPYGTTITSFIGTTVSTTGKTTIIRANLSGCRILLLQQRVG